MLIVEGNLRATAEKAYLSLEHKSQGKEIDITITKRDGKTRWSGEDLATICLTKADAEQLKRML